MKEEVFNKIEERIKEGWTFNIQTVYHITQITPKTYNRWKASGTKLFHNSQDEIGFYMTCGKHLEYINPMGCKLFFTK